MAVIKGAGLVMRALIEEGTMEVAMRMQNLALAEGALPRHLLSALYTRPTDGRLLTLRQLSRHLIMLWITGHPIAMALLRRILVSGSRICYNSYYFVLTNNSFVTQPAGLLRFLDSTDTVPSSALEEERLNNRDNLKIAQDHAMKNRKGAQWVVIERQFKVVEKRLEVPLLVYFVF